MLIVGGLSALVSGLYFGDRGWMRGYTEGWASGEAHGLTKRIEGLFDTGPIETRAVDPEDWWKHGMNNPFEVD
jgi:hypothetical protein